MKKIKLLIVTNKCTPYREPLFKLLDDKFDCYWIFTQEKTDHMKNTFFYKKNNYFIPKKLILITFIFSKILKLKQIDYCLSLPSVYLDCWQVFLACKIKKIKLILWDEEYIGKKSFKRNLIMPITNYINNNSNYILVPTKGHKEYQISRGINKQKIVLFPNVTNIIAHNKKNEVNKFNHKYNIGKKMVITYVGRLVREKGVQTLIKSYYFLIKNNEKIRKNTILLIVGDGLYGNNLKELGNKIKSLGGNIVFTGFINNEDISYFYNISYFGVVPSMNLHGRSEAYGLVVNEFLVNGKPVIVSDMVGANSLIKENKNFGYVFEEKNTKELLSYMKKILSYSYKEYELKSKKILESIKEYNSYTRCFQILNKILK